MLLITDLRLSEAFLLWSSTMPNNTLRLLQISALNQELSEFGNSGFITVESPIPKLTLGIHLLNESMHEKINDNKIRHTW